MNFDCSGTLLHYRRGWFTVLKREVGRLGARAVHYDAGRTCELRKSAVFFTDSLELSTKGAVTGTGTSSP